MVPSSNMIFKVFNAINLLQKPTEELFEALTPRPSCIISDFCISWTAKVVEKYHIPRISFNVFSCFSLHCVHMDGTDIKVTKELKPLMIPKANEEEINDLKEQMRDAEMKSYGVIINTIEELEKAYAQRGKDASINEHHCSKWLDLQQPKSVVYVCFGSLCNLIPAQLVEMALALEDTKRPFIWVIKEGSESRRSKSGFVNKGLRKGPKGEAL
ncbi:unnamed protein product [Sphenostylis stenocarpa]|uniref:Uncharacterized protein n=1 Tax=Sphenostylis stenocarpa TaxID=92480 RepID=A0AA86RQG2_9FABA|nr:unnamed protein product [Sphenostylis stenocarpa]